jgi:hypothetical protein
VVTRGAPLRETLALLPVVLALFFAALRIVLYFLKNPSVILRNSVWHLLQASAHFT